MFGRGMIDLHCHYLPGVDDGARTLEEGLALVRMSVADGITRIVLTPHVHPGRYQNSLSNLTPRFEAFRRAVTSAKIPIELALACEARLCDELLPLIERNQVPMLESDAGEKALLLEFSHNHLPTGCMEFIRWLRRRNITPLLVHPERNKELMAHPERLGALREAGCMVQITAAAVIGKFGIRAQNAAAIMLKNNWVDVVASDAHNQHHRPPLLREAAGYIALHFGASTAKKLFDTSPYSLASGGFRSSGPFTRAAS